MIIFPIHLEVDPLLDSADSAERWGAHYEYANRLPNDERGKLLASGGVNFPMLTAWYEAGYLAKADLRHHLARAWLNAGYTSLWGVEPLVRLFRAAGFVSDRPDTIPPPQSLTLYRGCDLDAPYGLSWTPDKNLAEFAAFNKYPLRSLPARRGVVVATVESARVLGMFGSHNLREIVIGPIGLVASECEDVDSTPKGFLPFVAEAFRTDPDLRNVFARVREVWSITVRPASPRDRISDGIDPQELERLRQMVLKMRDRA